MFPLGATCSGICVSPWYYMLRDVFPLGITCSGMCVPLWYYLLRDVRSPWHYLLRFEFLLGVLRHSLVGWGEIVSVKCNYKD